MNCKIIFILVIILPVACGTAWSSDNGRAYRALDKLPPLSDFERHLDAVTFGDPAVILLSCGYKWDSWNQTRFTVLRRIKILTREGMVYSNVSFRLRPGDQADDIAGRTVLPDGSVKELNPDDVKIEAVYDRLWGPEFIYSFELPGAKPGAVLEYTHTVVTQLGSGLRFNHWKLQDWVTTIQSRYTLDTPAEFMPFSSNIENYYSSATPTLEKENGRRIATYAFSDLPGLKRELAMPPASALLARLTVDYRWRGSPTADPIEFWRQLGRDVAARAEQFLEESQEVTSLVSEIVTGIEDTKGKAESICTWIQENTTQLSSLQPEELYSEGYLVHDESFSVDEVLEAGYGSPMEATLLALAMLRAAGVRSFLALAVDRRRGILRPTLLDPYQFDQPLVAVVLPDDRLLLLQPSVQDCPPLGVVWWVQGTLALVCTPSQGVVVSVPVDKPEANRSDYELDIALGREGVATGKLTATFSGQTAMQMKTVLRPLVPEDRKEYLRALFKKSLESLEIGKVTILNLDDYRKPLGVEMELVLPGYGRVKGGGLEFVPGLIAQSSDPSLGGEKRLHQIHLTYPRTERLIVSIDLPSGFRAEHFQDANYESDIGSYRVSSGLLHSRFTWRRELVRNRIFFDRREIIDLDLFSQFVKEGDLTPAFAYEK